MRIKGRGIDWDAIRDGYINTDRDLYHYSSEHTKLETHPTWLTLNARASREGWARLRNERIKNDYIEAVGKDAALQSEVLRVELATRDEILNANNAIVRHIRAAQELQKLSDELLPKFKKALSQLDLDEMAAEQPAKFIAAMKTIADFMHVATEIERKAIGLSDLKVEFNVAADDRDDLKKQIHALQSMDEADIIKGYLIDVEAS